MRKKRRASGILAALGIIIAYFILFPHPLQREVVARPRWVAPLPPPESLPAGGISRAPSGEGTASPFQLGELFGYVDGSGRLVHVEKTLFRVALGSAGFVNFTRVGADWVLRDPAGERLFSFAGRGYPLLSADGERVFIVKTDLTGLQEVDRSGETLWRRDFPSMLTSLSVAGDRVLAGLLNGSVELVNRAGDAVFSAAPAGSRLPVVLGAAAAPDGERVACVSGIDPQRLTVYGRKGTVYAELFRATLGSEFRRELRLSFSPDSRWLVVEGEGEVGMADPASGDLAWTSLGGTMAGAVFLGAQRAAAVLARGESGWGLVIASPLSAALLRGSFRADEASLGTVEDSILLGIDRRLLRIDVEAL